MSSIFLSVFNRSVAAAWLVLALVVLRLVFRKIPKWILVLLWALVAIRLILPVSIVSRASLVPSAQTIAPQTMVETPKITTGFSYLNSAINPVIRDSVVYVAPEKSISTLKLFVLIFSRVWAFGAAAMVGYMLWSCVRLSRRIGTAVRLRENIYQSEQVDSPFVFGLFRPKIYLPFQVETQNIAHMIAHEQAHIHRRDHWWKPLGFCLLSLHWFNPLMWLGYWLLCRDVELACDEKVIANFSPEQRADYSQSLLSCSVHRRAISACPLAFGEGNVKRRIRSVLHYKKPAFWILILALVAAVAVAVCFLTDPEDKAAPTTEPTVTEPTEPETTTPTTQLQQATFLVDLGALKQKYPMYFDLPTAKGLEVYVWQMAQGQYSCGLLPGRDPVYTDSELWDLHKNAATLEEMRVIVDSYGLSHEKISVIPIQMPHSSYWYEIDDTYRKNLQEMFWNTTPPVDAFLQSPVIAAASFDIDKDGNMENCALSYGPTSGLFTFMLRVEQDGKLKYYQIYEGAAGAFSFERDDNGVMVLKFDPDTPTDTVWEYDFGLADGNITLIPRDPSASQWHYWGPQGITP